jgi:hypothetical protein
MKNGKPILFHFAIFCFRTHQFSPQKPIKMPFAIGSIKRIQRAGSGTLRFGSVCALMTDAAVSLRRGAASAGGVGDSCPDDASPGDTGHGDTGGAAAEPDAFGTAPVAASDTALACVGRAKGEPLATEKNTIPTRLHNYCLVSKSLNNFELSFADRHDSAMRI